MNFLTKTLTLLLITGLITGCSSSLVYNRLDWLIPWYLNGYVDLSRDQRQTLREQLIPLLEWHRKEELRRYQSLLDQAGAELERTVDARQVEAWFDEITQATLRLEHIMLQPAVDFGATLSDRQVDEFIASLYSKQEKLEEELLMRSDADYVEVHTEHQKELLQRIIGRLSPQQIARLRQGSQAMQRFDVIWLSERKLWLDQLSIYLQRDSDWQQQLTQSFLQREESRPEEYKQIVEHNTQVIAAAIADVLNSRSSKQRTRTTRELSDMRAMLDKLINQKELN